MNKSTNMFETGSCCVARAALELSIQPPLPTDAQAVRKAKVGTHAPLPHCFSDIVLTCCV
jgi:hypothetical protein